MERSGKLRATALALCAYALQLTDNIAIRDMKLEEFVQENCMLSGGSHLLVPEGVTSERQRARYVVRVYRADIVTSTINKVNPFSRSADRIRPFVQISFAGLKVRACIL
jgi:hypothetical protein